MTARQKIALFAIGVIAVVVIFIAPVLLFAASNAVAGVLSLVLDRRPSESEVTGEYVYKAEWGQASLKLDSNHRFAESIANNNGSSANAQGTWSSSGTSSQIDNYLDLSFPSFLSVQDEDHGKRYDIAGLPAFKRRLGSVYVLINDDLGEQFTRVK